MSKARHLAKKHFKEGKYNNPYAVGSLAALEYISEQQNRIFNYNGYKPF